MYTYMSKKTFHCKKCKFVSYNKKDFGKHCKTQKHLTTLFFCSGCGKKYKYMSGLSRHKITCVEYEEEQLVNDSSIEIYNDTVDDKCDDKCDNEKDNNCNTNMKDLINIIKKQQQQITESHKMIEKVITETVPKIGNNNNNNISINVYLNEKCKNAMNLTDFVDKINVSLEDLMYTQHHGHTEGLANIFTKQLKDMNPMERPIHCSDSKRLQFYVKDDNTWHKDEKHIKIDKTINDVKIKQMKKLKQWEDVHPGYLADDNLLNAWQILVREIIGPCDSVKEKENNMICIKKQLANSIPFKYALKNN